MRCCRLHFYRFPGWKEAGWWLKEWEWARRYWWGRLLRTCRWESKRVSTAIAAFWTYREFHSSLQFHMTTANLKWQAFLAICFEMRLRVPSQCLSPTRLYWNMCVCSRGREKNDCWLYCTHPGPWIVRSWSSWVCLFVFEICRNGGSESDWWAAGWRA